MAHEQTEDSSESGKKPSLVKRALKYQVQPFIRTKNSLKEDGSKIIENLSVLGRMFKAVRTKSEVDNSEERARARFEELYLKHSWTKESIAQQIKGFRISKWMSLILCWICICGFFANGFWMDNLYAITFGCGFFLLTAFCMAIKAVQCAIYEHQIKERCLFGFSSFWARKDLLSLIFS